MGSGTTGVADDFGPLLRRHRRAAGVSQEELAHRSGVSARAISDMERGVARGPQQRTVEALGDALGLTGEVLHAFVLSARQGRQRKVAARIGLCELPRSPVDLIGRTAELEWIDGLVEATTDSEARTVTVSVIHGPAGIGKTSLAVMAGEKFASRFAGRVYFLDMRGADAQPLASVVALERLLRTLGVPEAALPVDADERASLFRSLVAQAPTMIVFDNVHDEAQVRPLLVRSASCLELLTSRRALSGLESVQRLDLGVLDAEAASRVLVSAAGVEVDGRAALEVAELCGYLPLALRIVGNRISARRHLAVDNLVALLRDQRYRLSMLATGDRQIRAAFEISYQQLSRSARQMFRRLSLIPQREFGEDAAAAVSGFDRLETILALDELMETSMLMPSDHDVRYQFHDLLQLFARERLQEEEDEDHQRTAVDALSEWALARLRASGDAVGIESCDEESLRWLDLEVGCWLFALEHEAARGRHREVSGAARSVHWYADMRVLRVPWDRVFSIGLRSARSAGDLSDTAALLNYISWGQWVYQGDVTKARDTALESLAAAREAGDRETEGWGLVAMSVYSRLQGHHDEAVVHATGATEIFTELGHSMGLQAAYVTHGLVYREQGMFERAVAVRRELLAELQRDNGDRTSDFHSMLLAASCRGLGDDLLAMGDWGESLAAYVMAAGVSEGVGRWTDHALALKGQGEVLLRMGRVSEAHEALTEALPALRDLVEHKAAAADAQRLLNDAARELSDVEEAQARLP